MNLFILIGAGWSRSGDSAARLLAAWWSPWQLRQFSIGGGLRQAKPVAEPTDAAPVTEPRQPEQSLAIAAELAGIFRGPASL